MDEDKLNIDPVPLLLHCAWLSPFANDCKSFICCLGSDTVPLLGLAVVFAGVLVLLSLPAPVFGATYLLLAESVAHFLLPLLLVPVVGMLFSLLMLVLAVVILLNILKNLVVMPLLVVISIN